MKIQIKKWFILNQKIKSIMLLLQLAIGSFISLNCQAKEIGIDEVSAVKALKGEAGGQSDDELMAHAYALKNRGTLRGVYGLYATHTPDPSAKQWQKVSKAWWHVLLDDGIDPMGGRTEWRSDYDLKLMIKRGETPENQGLYDPLKINQTTFYKLK